MGGTSAEQSSILEVREIAQCVEAELEEERFCRHISVGSAGRRTARARCDQAGATQIADQVARNFLAEKRRQSARVIGWK